jgi:hypothetical protein
MKKRFAVSLIALTLTALAACNSDPNPPPNTDETPLVTAAPEPVGTPVTQVVTASGGTITSGGITVEVPPNNVSNATFTLQPLTDTLNGTGQAIGISSSQTWSQYIKVTLPINASDGTRRGAGVALQQPDGSWQSRMAVEVNDTAGTITAYIPPSAARPSVQTAGWTVGAGRLYFIMGQFDPVYFKPARATLKVGATQTFTPYAKVVDEVDEEPGCSANIAVRRLCFLKTVTRELPLLNNKPGFTRDWAVNDIKGGNATVGTIVASGSSGALYTAPANKPNPSTVTIIFNSIRSAGDSAGISVEAPVTITDGVIQTYTGTISFSGTDNQIQGDGLGLYSWSASANITFSLFQGVAGWYFSQGPIPVTITREKCAPVTTNVGINGNLYVYSTSFGVIPDNSYVLRVDSPNGGPVMMNCQGWTQPRQVQVYFNGVDSKSTCPDDAPNWLPFTDIAALSGTVSKECPNSGNIGGSSKTTATWTLNGQ